MRERAELLDAFIDAAAAEGFPRNKDYNNGHQEGFGYYQVTQKNGERWSTARGFLDPARSRPNLRIETEALAPKSSWKASARSASPTRQHGVTQGSARQPRGHPCRRRGEVAAHAGVVRHRPARNC